MHLPTELWVEVFSYKAHFFEQIKVYRVLCREIYFAAKYFSLLYPSHKTRDIDVNTKIIHEITYQDFFDVRDGIIPDGFYFYGEKLCYECDPEKSTHQDVQIMHKLLDDNNIKINKIIYDISGEQWLPHETTELGKMLNPHDGKVYIKLKDVKVDSLDNVNVDDHIYEYDEDEDATQYVFRNHYDFSEQISVYEDDKTVMAIGDHIIPLKNIFIIIKLIDQNKFTTEFIPKGRRTMERKIYDSDTFIVRFNPMISD
jgi:hypothetical protein